MNLTIQQFWMKLVQYDKYLYSTVYTDSLER